MASASDGAELSTDPRRSQVATLSRTEGAAIHEQQDGPRGVLMAPLLARAIAGVVFTGLCVVALLFVLQSGKSPGEVVLAIACLLVLLALQLFYFTRPSTKLRSPLTYAVLAVQACLAYLPLLEFGQSWISMPILLAGSVLLVAPPAIAWVVFTLFVASTAWIQVIISGSVLALDVGYTTIGAGVTGLYVYGLTRLARLITELHAARTQLATTAVAHERLRFARDLHDLLGLSLSAIAPKGELTHRLVTKNPERARQELSEILDISRRALADVRSVASGYRELSLDEESRTVGSVLASSNVNLRMDVNHGDLPAHVRTVLATVLREGVTNVLRHSNAERCEITLRQAGHTVSLDIINDGVGEAVNDEVEAGTDHRNGSGIRNLTERAATLGGELTAGLDSDGRFRLHLTVPVSDKQAKRHGSEPGDESGEQTPRIAANLARALVVAVFCGVFAKAVLQILYLTEDFFTVATSSVYMATLLVIQLAYFSRPGIQIRSSATYTLLAVQAVLVYLPLLQFQEAWVSMPGFLAGSALLVLRPAVAWPLFVAIVGSVAWAQVGIGGSPRDIGFNIAVAVMNGLVVYGLTWMARSVTELRAARRQLAEVAVAEERLRFARDLHDLLGLSLSAITLKSELAHRLMAANPARAKEELTEILSISRQALADVRSVASGYRELSLHEESRSAESLLAAADVDVRMDLHYGELPVHVGTVLATVLREGVTNVLRHSKGERCEITVRQRDDVVSLDIVNDGVADSAAGPHKGSGIHNLSDRVAKLGGELTAGVESDGRFRLRARVPA